MIDSVRIELELDFALISQLLAHAEVNRAYWTPPKSVKLRVPDPSDFFSSWTHKLTMRNCWYICVYELVLVLEFSVSSIRDLEAGLGFGARVWCVPLADVFDSHGTNLNVIYSSFYSLPWVHWGRKISRRLQLLCVNNHLDEYNVRFNCYCQFHG